MSQDVILVPLKRFDIAKFRLRRSGVLDATDIARDLAVGVLRACSPRDVIVITESDEIANFADEHSVESFKSDATDLNLAVSLAYRFARARYARVFVAHGDLRDPSGLGTFDPEAGVTVVTDHHGTGTNVLILPTGLDFTFAYGSNSAQRHLEEASRLEMATTLIVDSPWRFDVDELADLD